MQEIDFTKIQIRKAEDDDLPEIITLLSEDDELGRNRELGLVNQKVPECYLNTYHQIKNNPNCMLIVMDYNHEVIGTLQLILIPTLTLNGCIRAEVEGVRVKSTYQKRGLGRFMFQWVKNTAIEKKCGLIQLTTNKCRDSAQGFYKAIGFIDSHCGMKMKLL